MNVIVTALCLLAGMAVQLYAEDKEAIAHRLFDQARTASDIRGPGSSAFRLEARVKSLENGRATEGKYIEVWASPRQWHRDLSIGDYSYVEISDPNDDKRMWVLENKLGNELAKGLLTLVTLSDLRTDFKFNNQKVRKVFEKKGVRLRCVETQTGNDVKHTFCFDADSNELRTTDTSSCYLSHDRWTRCHTLVAEYTAYQRFNAAVFPTTIRTMSEGHSMELTVTKFESQMNASSYTFALPAGATSRPACATPMNPPKILHRSNPGLPAGLSVRLWYIVGADGKPREIKVLQSQNAAFAELILKIVQETVYAPATCEGIPVEGHLTEEISVSP